MKDAMGTEIKIGDPVRFFENCYAGWKLGKIVAVIDDQTVALSGQTFQTAKGSSLLVIPPKQSLFSRLFDR